MKMNFFDAGGNSMLLTKLQKEIENEFGMKFSIVDFMTYSNIGAFADYISEKTAT